MKTVARHASHEATYHKDLGNAYKRQGDYLAAEKSLERAVSLDPTLAEAHYDLGIVCQVTGQMDRALACYQACVKINPGYAAAWNNMGLVQLSLGDLDAASRSIETAIANNRNFAGAYNNLAMIRVAHGQFEKAIELSRQAIAIAPEDYRAYHNMGNALLKQDRYQQAVACYRKGLQSSPEHPELLNSMGVAFQKNGDAEKAIACFQKAVRQKPDAHKTYIHLYNQLRQICDWSNAETISGVIDELTQSDLQKKKVPVEPPFMSICRDMDERRHYRIARVWSRQLEKAAATNRPSFERPCKARDGKRLRIGYLSNNFRNHPTTHLLCRLFDLHNRKRVHISAYSCSRRSNHVYARLIQNSADAFKELYSMNTRDAAAVIADDGIDILVDLNGFTDGHRMEICALRPAPIQVRYLGMAGTSGASFFDYLIGDHIVTPAASEPFYSEALVRMPHTYQANSYRYENDLSPVSESNSADGDSKFTYCCFCSNYKLEPDLFKTWMSILRQVPGSLLWLLRESPSMERNLVRQAADAGIAPERLRFGNKMNKTDHLERLSRADLALDTRIVTGAATTSDALWAGVPVVSVMGSHFASRMSASILTAASLPELVVDDMEKYESLAVELATNAEKMAAIRDRLASVRQSAPLFDTCRFVGNLENAFEQMWDHHCRGLSPRSIHVHEDAKQTGKHCQPDPAITPQKASSHPSLKETA